MSLRNLLCFLPLWLVALTMFPLSNAAASGPAVFAKFTLHRIEPAEHPVQIGITFYNPIYERLHRAHLSKNGTVTFFSVGWHDRMPWKTFADSDAVWAGESTAWIDLSPFFAQKRPQQIAAVSFWQKGGQPLPNARADDGNVASYDVEIALASAPDENHVVTRLRYASAFPNLPLYFPANAGPLDVWGPGLRTLHSYALDRLAVCEKLGLPMLPTDRPFDIVVDTHRYYHASLYDAATEEVEALLRARLGENQQMFFVSLISGDLWAPELAEQIGKILDKELPSPPPGRFTVQLGDEPHIPTTETLQKSEAGMNAFRAWLATRVATPGDVGAASWDEVQPVTRGEIQNPAQARLYYHTVWFLQESAIQLLRTYREACHARWGDRVTVMTDTYYAGFEVTPDYFLESRKGATDRFGHHFGGEFRNTFDLFNADLLRSAAQAGQTAPGFLYFVCRINEPEGVALTGHAALIRGLNSIRYYGYGPFYASGEWFSDDRYKTDVFAAAAATSRVAATQARYFAQGRAPRPQVATLLSRSASIWSGSKESAMIEVFGHPQAQEEYAKLLAQTQGEGAAEGWSCERNMIHCALAWAGHPVAVLPEEDVEAGLLNGEYRALYIYEPNLSAAAQERVISWVKEGGVLYLGPQAATRDESNGPLDLLAGLTGTKASARVAAFEPRGQFLQPGKTEEAWRATANYHEAHALKLSVLDTITMREEPSTSTPLSFPALGWKENLFLTDADVRATYADGAPALVVLSVGRGHVIKSGTCLGAAWARSATPSLAMQWYPKELEVLPYFWPQKQTWQREFDDRLQDVILLPTVLAGVEPAVRLSSRGVDAGFFEMPDGSGAILLLSNYRTTSPQTLSIEIPFQHHYTRAIVSSDGRSLPVSVREGRHVIELPLDVTEVIEFLP